MRSFLLPSKLLRSIVVGSLLTCIVQIQASNWSGGVISDANSNIDTNFTILNSNLLVGQIQVSAVTRDVTATVGANAVLVGQNSTNPGRLFISASAGRTVFFDLTNNDLSFVGSADHLTRLLVSFSGEGQLVFILGNGHRIAFAADETTVSAGTNFFVVMNSSTTGSRVTFTRADKNSPLPVEVLVGRDSQITYLVNQNSPTAAQAVGSVQFDPTNASAAGVMNLRVLDNASVDISGHLANIDAQNRYTNSDVHYDLLGGDAALFTVFNTNTTPVGNSVANLRVINTNTVFPHLRADPFCDDSFTGVLPGFVLGANGILTIEDSSYLDYVGAALNTCLSLTDIDCECDFTCTLTILRSPIDAKKELTRASCLVDINDEDIDVDELIASLDLHIAKCNVCGVTDGGCECIQFKQAANCFVKTRNASAFFIDGLDHVTCPDPLVCQHAQINMLGCSGIYFRSGIDACGEVNEADGFIINPMGGFNALKSCGVGNILLDVEGYVEVNGSSANSNAIRILSDQVVNAGCPVIIASEASCPTNLVFPALTHNKSFDGEYLRYNKGAFLINNRLALHDVSLVHTDDNHHVLERDDLDRGDPRIFSEPTYIGGEFHIACKTDAPRPTIALYNSIIRFHESAGFTGVDIQVPNLFTPPAGGNNSVLRFYSNGACVDRGNGRIVILGTDHGDRSCGSRTLIDYNSHLDIFQTTNQPTATAHVLTLDTGRNDGCFSVTLTSVAPENENSIQTIFLGNESNISIGTAPKLPAFTPATRPTVVIDGAFFSFETNGGSVHLPELTGTVGQGAIFVDTNGIFRNANRNRANISTMVVRSGNGVVDLPETEIYFDSRVGVTDWRPTMTVDNILVKPGELFSDFTIDWMQVITDCTAFVPYNPAMTPLACRVPPVTEANLTLLPTILGTVDQLQVKRSRLGDQITLQIGSTEANAGGFVRELVFLNGFNSAEAAMGTIVLDNWGRVGLGSAKRNYDSNDANIKLGINGITVIAKGNGVVELNEDIIIDNVCPILPGPDFGANGIQTLVIFSDDAKEFRVKSNGVLDLSAFKGPNQVIEFGGNMRIVFEPGAKLLLSNVAGAANRTHLLFTDTTSINFERVFDTELLQATVPNAVRDRLVKFIGNGDITMNEGSTLLLPNDTFLGIESDPECTLFTDIHWNLLDQATFNVGDANDLGGTFQVGNRTNLTGAQVNFELVLNGVGTEFQIRREGLVLFGVGGVSVEGTIPNNYTYQCLSNVGTVAISLLQGKFTHNQIFPGDNPLAALLVVGPAQAYDFSFDVNNSLIRGGGNFALVSSCPTTASFPISVLEFNGTLLGSNVTTGLFSSKDQLQDEAVFPSSPFDGLQSVTGLTSAQIYNYLAVRTYNGYFDPASTIALNTLSIPTLGFVTNNTVINRVLRSRIVNSSGIEADFDRSVRRGAVNIKVIDSTGRILSVTEIQGAV